MAAAPADTTFKGVAFAPAPEPAIWALLLTGFSFIGARLRRRSRGFARA